MPRVGWTRCATYLGEVWKLGVFALATLALTLVAACADGGESDGPSLTVVTSTSTPGDDGQQSTPTSADDPATSPATTEPPTATSTPGDDGAIVVACGDLLAPLDKQHRLEEDCVPANLVAVPDYLASVGGMSVTADTFAALEQMLSDASAEGHTLLVLSSYRSYDRQIQAFNNNVAQFGEEEARRVSALPGHSEHQLGTTVDLTSAAVGYTLDKALGGTPEGVWLAEHSWEHGFIISYPQGMEAVTGYDYEPWHLRYVGVDVAADVRASGLTLHEYLLR